MKGIRLVAFVLVMLLAVGSGIALAEQDDAGEAEAPTASYPSLEPGAEIPDARTANSQTFRLQAGGRETRIYPNPIYYRDGEGEWTPVGDALQEDPNGASLTNGPNGFEVDLPAQIDSGSARFAIGKEWISTQLVGPNTEAVQLEGRTASYETPSGKLSFDYTGLANGLKEEIEIADASQPSSFTFDLDASSGLTPGLNERGEIEFRNASDELIATLPAPTITDSAPDAAVSHAASYDLVPNDQGWRLTVKADPEWLAQPDRVWPAHLDPTVTVPTPSLDCTFGGKAASNNTASCGTSGAKVLTAAYWPKLNSAEDEWFRTLLSFNLNSVIPAESYVASATVGLRQSEAAQNTSGVELRQVDKAWTKNAKLAPQLRLRQAMGPRRVEHRRRRLHDRPGHGLDLRRGTQSGPLDLPRGRQRGRRTGAQNGKRPQIRHAELPCQADRRQSARMLESCTQRSATSNRAPRRTPKTGPPSRSSTSRRLQRKQAHLANEAR